MYKTVLVTIDLEHSASWERALPVAIEIAKSSGALLHVLTVVPDFGSPLVAIDFPADYQERALTAAKARLEELRGGEVPWPLNAVSHVGIGRVHEVILEFIASLDADLVVMASHAPDRVREFLVGSQADRVVRRSPVSVLVVR